MRSMLDILSRGFLRDISSNTRIQRHGGLVKRTFSETIPPNRPRAVKSAKDAPKRKVSSERKFITFAVLVGIAPAALYIYKNWNNIEWDSFSSYYNADIESLRSLLPTYDQFIDPVTEEGGRMFRGGMLKKPVATVVLGWEDQVVSSEFSPKHGYLLSISPSLLDFFNTLRSARIEVIFWSTNLMGLDVREQLNQLLEMIFVAHPKEKQAFEDFKKTVEASYHSAVAFEVERARKEHRAPRPVYPITPSDYMELFARHKYGIAATLGIESCNRPSIFASKDQLDRPVGIVTMNRFQDRVLDLIGSRRVPSNSKQIKSLGVVPSDKSLSPYPSLTDESSRESDIATRWNLFVEGAEKKLKVSEGNPWLGDGNGFQLLSYFLEKELENAEEEEKRLRLMKK